MHKNLHMNRFLFVVFFLTAITSSFTIKAQITAPRADSTLIRFGEEFHLFCASSHLEANGSLQAITPNGDKAGFAWGKYDEAAGAFLPFAGTVIDNDSLSSEIRNLSDGLYRVTITTENLTFEPIEAWVLNNWIEITKTEIPDSSSTCEAFKIEADYEFAPLEVNSPNQGIIPVRNANKEPLVEWYHKGDLVRRYISPEIYPPTASNNSLRYELIIEDEFGCVVEGFIDYVSKVPKADFSASPMQGEAVLEVNFTNSSINYDSVYWFFYKDSYIITREIERTDGQPIDSIAFVLTDDAPVHEYKQSGEYTVRLVAVKENPTTGNCYDTLYMEPGTFINVQISLVEVPNFFTPNGDGINDVFVVGSRSLKSLDIVIFNRWGGKVHSWSYSNITTSEYTMKHAVWDGRVGNGRMASPGVYYYVIKYEGRDIDKEDDKGRMVKETLNGFIHLFREKQ
jgi:gliding motility-associated-like protein